MKIKVDENIGRAGVEMLRSAGHDVMTVREQGLAGAADKAVFQVCLAEDRALITLDRDFGQVPRFPPKDGAGIIILELGGPASLVLLRKRIGDVVDLLARRTVAGELWIVEPGRLRVHLTRDDD